jgi:hypothetical protein
MRSITMAGLCLLATLAVCASAQAYITTPAVPEYGKCFPLVSPNGFYKSPMCTEPGGTKAREWYAAFGSAKPLVKKHFTIEKNGLLMPTLEGVSGAKIVCTGVGGSGEYIGNKTQGLAVLFTGCETSGIHCENAGPVNGGEIDTTGLISELGVLKQEALGTHAVIGQETRPATPGADFADFSCAAGAVTMRVRGAIFTKRTANVNQLAAVLSYTELKGTQKYAHFEGGPSAQLELSQSGGAFELWGFHGALKLKNEEPVDIHCAPEGC